MENRLMLMEIHWSSLLDITLGFARRQKFNLQGKNKQLKDQLLFITVNNCLFIIITYRIRNTSYKELSCVLHILY